MTQLTQVATRTDVAVKVANAVAVVALTVVILTTFGSIARSFGFVSTSTTATTFRCSDTDGGKIWQRKGTTTANTIRGPRVDSCLDSQVLLENFCDATNKTIGSVKRNCVYGCNGNGACLSTSTPPVATTSVSTTFISASSNTTIVAEGPGETDIGEFVINFAVDNSSNKDIWIDRDQVDRYQPVADAQGGLYYHVIDTDSNPSSTVPVVTTFVSPSSLVGDSSLGFKVAASSSRNFSFRANVTPTAIGPYYLRINGLMWDIDNDGSPKYLISGSLFDQFKTNPIILKILQ